MWCSPKQTSQQHTNLSLTKTEPNKKLTGGELHNFFSFCFKISKKTFKQRFLHLITNTQNQWQHQTIERTSTTTKISAINIYALLRWRFVVCCVVCCFFFVVLYVACCVFVCWLLLLCGCSSALVFFFRLCRVVALQLF